MLELNKIHCGNCLKLMPDIESESIDMILSDIPYGITACKWDSIIPLEPMWAQLKRIIKPNGAIVMTASQPFTTTLISSNMKMFKYEWIWEKERGTNFLNFKYQPSKAHENIVVFGHSATSYSKKSIMKYNPLMEKGDAYTCKQGYAGDAIARDVKTRTNSNNIVTNNKGVRYPKSYQYFKTETGLHPTQKPVALMEYLIKTYTNENDVVLDFTIGSGTTAVACIKTDRQYIGIELDEGYCEIAEKRIFQEQQQLKLF